MAIYTGTNGRDEFFGTIYDDAFYFSIAALARTDLVNGGAGYDVLRFTDAGTITAGQLAGVQGIERIVLANGTNTLQLTDALSTSITGPYNLVVEGGSGDDTIVGAANGYVYMYTGAGNDTLSSGNRGGWFQFNAGSLDDRDRVTGGSGLDQLQLMGIGATTAQMLRGVSGIEAIYFDGGSLALDDAFLIANTSSLTLGGSSGNDVIDLSAVTAAAGGRTLYLTSGGGGNDRLIGGATRDIIQLTNGDLTAADVIVGGGGIDRLRIGAGTHAASAFAGVSGVEELEIFPSGDSDVTVNDALIAAAGGRLAISQMGTASHYIYRIDASALTGAHAVDITMRANSTALLTGGAGDDRFRFQAGDLGAADRVDGGGGTNRLAFTTAGTVAAADLAGATNIQEIALETGGITLTLTDAAMAGLGTPMLQGRSLIVLGSAGNDVVDASALTTAGGRLVIHAGAGDDVLRGGASESGATVFRFDAADLTAADVVTGRGSWNVLQFLTSGTIAAADLSGVTGVSEIWLAGGGNTLTIDNAFVAASNAFGVRIRSGAGSDTINASGVGAGRSVSFESGGGADVLRGGAGNDSFSFFDGGLTGSTVVGGAGLDTVYVGPGQHAAAALAGVSGVEQLGVGYWGTRYAIDSAFMAANGSAISAQLAPNGAVDASGVTDAGHRVAFLLYYPGFTETVVGGAGDDIVAIWSPDVLSGTDAIAGGGGRDTLRFEGTGTVTAAMLSGVSAVERIELRGGSVLTLDDAIVATAVGRTLSVSTFYEGVPFAGATTGGSGTPGAVDDRIDGSAVIDARHSLDIYTHDGNDRIVGGAGDDTVTFRIAFLSAGDSVSGGVGYDTLRLTGGGAVDAAALSGVAGFEVFALVDPGTTLMLDSAIVARNSAGGMLTVTGSAGADTVEVAGAGAAIVFAAGAGNDRFTGGAAADSVRIAVADLTSADRLAGGMGEGDTLHFLTAGAIGADKLTNVAGFETIRLANGRNTLTLRDAFVGSTDTTMLRVEGGAGNDAVIGNALGLTSRALWIEAGLGNDKLKGGASGDTFAFAVDALTGADLVSGGRGAAIDTLRLRGDGTVGAGAFGKVVGIEAIVVDGGAIGLTLDNGFATANAAALTIDVRAATGSDVDAGSVARSDRAWRFLLGSGIDHVRGGASGDTFVFAAPADLTPEDLIAGNDGSDTLVFEQAGTITAAALANVTGVETIRLGQGANTIAIDNALVASAGGLLTIVGGGDDRIDGSALLAPNAIDITAGGGIDTLTGGAGADAFRFTTGEIGAADTIDGGAGRDRLYLAGGGSVAAAALSGMRGVEAITLVDAIALAIDDVVGEVNPALSIQGSAGDDVIDASAMTGATGGVIMIAGRGADQLTGGLGSDDFRFAASEIGADDRVGGGGGAAIDSFVFTAAGGTAAADLAGVAGIERFVLSDGGNRLSLSDVQAGSAFGQRIVVIGGAGNDQVSAAAVTLAGATTEIVAGGGDDELRGGAGADLFRFTAGQIAAQDIVAGGGGAAIDTLAIGGSGVIASGALAQVSAIERLRLENGGLTLRLGDAFLAANAAVQIEGSSGDDVIDAGEATRGMVASAGRGSDRLTGGAGADTFLIAIADLTAADALRGGSGIDTLRFLTAGIIAPAALAGLAEVERIELAAGASNLRLSTAVIAAAGGQLTIVGGGDDTIDASAVTGTGAIEVIAGAGADLIRGGAGADVFRFAVADLDAADLVSGGAGQDTLVLTGAGFTAAALAGVSGIESVQLSGGTTLAIDNGFLERNGPRLTVVASGGNERIDAGAVTDAALSIAVTAGTGDDVLIGGAGADIFTFGPAELRGTDVVTGGGGAAIDTLAFAAAGTIQAGSLANVSGIERITLAYGINAITLANALVATAYATTLAVVGSDDADTINGAAVSNAAHRLDFTAGGGDDVLTGGRGDDIFRFDVFGLDGDTVAGGLGQDTLSLSGTGAIAAAAMAQVSGIERIVLENGGIAIVVPDAVFAGALGNALTVIGSAGADTIDAATVTGGTVSIAAGAGNDRVIVGANAVPQVDLGEGDDRLVIAAAGGLGAARGGLGTDTIELDVRGVAAPLVDLRGRILDGFERIDLTDSIDTPVSNLVTLFAPDAAGLVVAARDDRHAYAITLGAGGQTAIGGAASDRLTGGAGDDRLTGGMGDDLLDGGGGRDELTGGDGDDAIAYDPADAAARGGAGMDVLRSATGGSFDLGLADQSLGDAVAVSGFEHVDAGGSTLTVTIVGRAGLVSALTGGSGDDTITAGADGARIAGGIGADRLFGASGADTFVLRAGYAAAGETIRGGGGDDAIEVDGEVDLSAIDIAEVERIVFAGQQATVTLTVAQALAIARFDARAAAPVALSIMLTPGQTVDLSPLQRLGFDRDDRIVLLGAGADPIVLTGDATLGTYTGATVETWDYANETGLILDGGEGIDTLRIPASAVWSGSVLLNEADQTADDRTIVRGFEHVDASEAGRNVWVRGSAGANQIVGSAFGDTVDGNGGRDRITLGGGFDTAYYHGSESLIDGGADDDQLYLLGYVPVIDMDAADHTIGDGAVVTGFEYVEGAFSARGMTILGRSQLYGQPRDFISGTTGSDHVVARAATHFSPNGGSDTFRGGAGDDVVAISIGGGDLRFSRGWAPGTMLAGGAGWDRIELTDQSEVLRLLSFAGARISGFEALHLSCGNGVGMALTSDEIAQFREITIQADYRRDPFDPRPAETSRLEIYVMPGDTIDLSGLEVSIDRGGDPSSVPEGEIVIWRGTGDAPIIIRPDIDGRFHLGTYTNASDTGGYSNFDWIMGTDGADTLVGTPVPATSARIQFLVGGVGADRLVSGGNSTMSGGEGIDTFVATLPAMRDPDDPSRLYSFFIVDLEPHDVLDLTAIDADETMEGDQAFRLVEAFTGTAGELRIVLDAANANASGNLEGDVDGDGIGEVIGGFSNTLAMDTSGWLL